MTKQRKVRIHVEGLKASGRRFVHAWQRAERGEPVHEEHLSFESLERLLATLSPKRIELVRFVRRRPNLSIAARSRANLGEITNGCIVMSAPWRWLGCWKRAKPDCTRHSRGLTRSSRSHDTGRSDLHKGP
jgi:hypothetical protein